MKKISLIVQVIGLALFLSACGSSGRAPDENTDTNNIRVDVVYCDNNEINSYTNIEPNDTLVKDSNITFIKILHDSNDARKVCVKEGAAYLLR